MEFTSKARARETRMADEKSARKKKIPGLLPSPEKRKAGASQIGTPYLIPLCGWAFRLTRKY
jgi:hypothetical protein